MARDAVTITALSLDAGVDAVAGTTITPANGATIAAAGNTHKLVLYVTNTESAGYDVTIKAPTDNPNAVRSGLGDLVYEIGAGEEAYFVIESARFAQTSGAIFVDFETGMTGAIAAYRLPAGS